ncbi:MAG: hypothetical protein A7315_12740 [Candidatus Altiarchaeales archaeon WOR_SM1_79]|nr:MAG: hypothetical protein A7315_12740 [Candidatus Altiarchaeales archaeon WOR_SM1_79]
MACLASRIPCGKRLTKERLDRIERAEDSIQKILDSNVVVRVRDHDRIARIECSDISLIFRNRDKIIEKLKDLGFEYVTVDLEGYRGVV